MLLFNLDTKARLVNGSRGVVVGWLEVDVNAEAGPGTNFLKSVLGQVKDAGSAFELRKWFKMNQRVPIVRFSSGKKGEVMEVPVPPVLFSASMPSLGLCLRAQVRASQGSDSFQEQSLAALLGAHGYIDCMR